ncbi:hypothetical protein D3C71_952950 [compost metagenome]
MVTTRSLILEVPVSAIKLAVTVLLLALSSVAVRRTVSATVSVKGTDRLPCESV